MWVTVKTHGISNQWGTVDLARIDGTFVPDELLQWGLVPIFYSNFDTFKSFSNVSFCAYRGSSSFLSSSSIFTEDKLSHIHRDGLLTVCAPHFPFCPHPPMPPIQHVCLEPSKAVVSRHSGSSVDPTKHAHHTLWPYTTSHWPSDTWPQVLEN